jgi:HAD superfamily hydrolase (TIGR01509 family)
MSFAGVPAGLVFDMDGLLLDSERLALEAFVAACRRCGVEPDVAHYLPCIGTTHASTLAILRQGYGAEFPLDDVVVEWSRIYGARVHDEPVPLKPGARDALECVTAAGIPVAVATSTARATAEHKLGLAGLSAYVLHVVGGDEVARGKPDPAPYLEAARRLGRPPQRCWAVEDSDNGVRSAHAAGLQVIQVPDLVPPGSEVRRLGHPILGSLRDFVELFQSELR